MSTDKNKFSLERETSKFMNSSQILQAKLTEKKGNSSREEALHKGGFLYIHAGSIATTLPR